VAAGSGSSVIASTPLFWWPPRPCRWSSRLRSRPGRQRGGGRRWEPPHEEADLVALPKRPTAWLASVDLSAGSRFLPSASAEPPKVPLDRRSRGHDHPHVIRVLALFRFRPSPTASPSAGGLAPGCSSDVGSESRCGNQSWPRRREQVGASAPRPCWRASPELANPPFSARHMGDLRLGPLHVGVRSVPCTDPVPTRPILGLALGGQP